MPKLILMLLLGILTACQTMPNQHKTPDFKKTSLLQELIDSVSELESEVVEEVRFMAEMEDVASQNRLASWHLFNQEDQKKAIVWFKKSCQNGSDLGCIFMSKLNKELENPNLSYIEQLRLLSKQGDKQAQFELSLMYSIGLYIEKDEQKALNLLKNSAYQGYAPAQYELGNKYILGNDFQVAKDYDKAFYWLKKSAEQHFYKAQNNLATLYAYGVGVTQDKKEAESWYHLACINGYENACDYELELEQQGFGNEELIDSQDY